MRALHKAYPEVLELSPHELRHTRATLWIAQRMDPYMAARLLGHSDLKMLTKIYDHTSTETLRKGLLNVQKNGEVQMECADDLLRNRRRIRYFMSFSRASICLKSSMYFWYSERRGQLEGI